MWVKQLIYWIPTEIDVINLQKKIPNRTTTTEKTTAMNVIVIREIDELKEKNKQQQQQQKDFSSY